MLSLSTDIARRKLLSLLPRKFLEELSGLERPHMATRTELIVECSAKHWDEHLVRKELEAVWVKANREN